MPLVPHLLPISSYKFPRPTGGSNKKGHQISHLNDNGLLTMCEQKRFSSGKNHGQLQCAQYNREKERWEKLETNRMQGRQTLFNQSVNASMPLHL